MEGTSFSSSGLVSLSNSISRYHYSFWCSPGLAFWLFTFIFVRSKRANSSKKIWKMISVFNLKIEWKIKQRIAEAEFYYLHALICTIKLNFRKTEAEENSPSRVLSLEDVVSKRALIDDLFCLCLNWMPTILTTVAIKCVDKIVSFSKFSSNDKNVFTKKSICFLVFRCNNVSNFFVIAALKRHRDCWSRGYRWKQFFIWTQKWKIYYFLSFYFQTFFLSQGLLGNTLFSSSWSDLRLLLLWTDWRCNGGEWKSFN